MQLTAPGARLLAGCAARATLPALANGCVADASIPSCSYREYATEGETDPLTAYKRRFLRRPTRHGSKLAMRDPEKFRRMRAILGYPDDTSNGKVERVTVSLLQTVKYLMPGEQQHLSALASYKVTSLNRELLPLMEQTRQLLEGKSSNTASKGAGATSKPAANRAAKQ